MMAQSASGRCSIRATDHDLRHVLSTVDPARGRATIVLREEGAGAARLEGKQAVYVQAGETVRRWPSIAAVGAEPGTPIMPGVVLVVPRSSRSDCCGLSSIR